MREKKKYIDERKVWLVDLDPTKGVEIQKTRPCIVLRKISKHQYIVLPITSKKKSKKLVYDLGCPKFLDKTENYINIFQIRTVDCSRFRRFMGKVTTFQFCKIQKKSAKVLKLLPREPSGHNEP